MQNKTTTILLKSIIFLFTGCAANNLGQITDQTLKKDNLKILSRSRTFAVVPVVEIPQMNLSSSLGLPDSASFPYSVNQELISDIKVAQSLEHELKKRGYIQTIAPMAQTIITYARQELDSSDSTSTKKKTIFFNLTARNSSSGQILYFVRIRVPYKLGKNESLFQKIAGALVWQALEQFPRRDYKTTQLRQAARL